jgi:hypothetical protein
VSSLRIFKERGEKTMNSCSGYHKRDGKEVKKRWMMMIEEGYHRKRGDQLFVSLLFYYLSILYQ